MCVVLELKASKKLASMFSAVEEEDVLELSEAVLACDLRRKVYNSDGHLTDPYAHFLCRSRGYVLCKR